MSDVKRWYIGVYGGQAQARACTPRGAPHGLGIIRDHEGQIFVLASDFDRVTAERDQLQQDLTTADQQVDNLTAWVKKYRNVIASRRYSDNDEGDMRQRADRIELERIDTALKPAEGGSDVG